MNPSDFYPEPLLNSSTKSPSKFLIYIGIESEDLL